MEAISNVATTASKTVSNLIYGQSAKDNEAANQEPLSGEQGKGTAKEPFDQGNEIGGQEPLSGEQGKGTAREPFDQGNAAGKWMLSLESLVFRTFQGRLWNVAEFLFYRLRYEFERY
jgi:hypothetical protein